MSIIRVHHKKNYTVVNNSIIKDNRISFKAKGILIYALSRPDNWEFYLSDLVKQSTEGKYSITQGLKELEKAGYLRRARIRNPDGTLGKSEWNLFETCTIENDEKDKFNFDSPESSYPTLDNPKLDNPTLDNQTLTSTDVKTSTDSKTIIENNNKQGVVVVKETFVDDSHEETEEKCKSIPKKRETSDIVYKKTNGTELVMPEDEVYRYFLKKQYSTEILKKAIDVARYHDGHINDIMKFIEGICKNLQQQKYIDSTKSEKKKKTSWEDLPKQNGPTVSMGDVMKKMGLRGFQKDSDKGK